MRSDPAVLLRCLAAGVEQNDSPMVPGDWVMVAVEGRDEEGRVTVNGTICEIGDGLSLLAAYPDGVRLLRRPRRLGTMRLVLVALDGTAHATDVSRPSLA